MPDKVTALKAKQTITTAPSVPPVRCTAVIPNFDELPDSALVRQAQLVRDPKNPTKPVPLPFSAASLWRKVKSGDFPQPLRLSGSITCWKVGTVRVWLAQQEATNGVPMAMEGK